MKYFELIPDPDTTNPIQLLKVDGKVYKNGLSEEKFKEIPPLSVGYFENLPQRELYDVLQEPAFLISDRVKRLIALYEPKMEFKGIQLFPERENDSTMPLFWIPCLISVDCLSRQTEKYSNGMIKKLLLDSRGDYKHHIFRVGGILEHKVLISLPLAESMLRRRVSGIALVPVHFSQEEFR